MQQLKIEKAAKTDVREIVTLEEKCFSSDRFSYKQFMYLVNSSKALSLIVRQGHELLAYMVLLTRKNSKKCRLYSIAISPQSRGKGIAKMLLAHAESFAQDKNANELTLEVSEKNIPAIQLYLNFGFRHAGTRKKYYADGSDALLMVKNINATLPGKN